MTNNIQTNKNLIELASNLRKFIQKKGWVSRYDSEADALSMSVPKLSKDSRIKYFDDEVAFYITKANNIEGIFVEYFKSNFIKHHKDLQPVMRGIKSGRGNGKKIIKLSSEKTKKIAPDLQDTVRSLLAQKINLGVTQRR